MIKKITLKKNACFKNDEEILDDITKINFLYGANGSGKTTISRVINNDEIFDECKLNWDNNELKTLVYNEDFIEKNFFKPENIKGVFTLGEKSKEIEEKIKENKMEIDKLRNNIKGLNSTKEKKIKEKKGYEDEFKERCWKIEKDLDGMFDEALTGFRGDKSKFKNKVISEIDNDSKLLSLEELKSKSDKIFDKNAEKTKKIKTINFDEIKKIIQSSIFKEKIIGKEDVDIADMINKLENSDWVKQGIKYYDEEIKICPFCQQKISDDFKNKLEAYFDDTYNEKIKKLRGILDEYSCETDDLINNLKKLLDLDNDFLKKEAINKESEIIEVKVLNNKSKIKNKIEEPSKVINLDLFLENLKRINQLIMSANIEIDEYNEMIDNIEEEEKKLKSKIWKYIVSKLESDYDRYEENIENIDKALKSLKIQIKENKNNIKELENENEKLESEIKSIKPTINKINSILKSFGYTNFELDESKKKGYYKIVRESGEDAKNTLSEGEKTFITFLYFYYLLHGSYNDDTITKDKVVVFDDPISSLDSNILFVVSNLVKKIIREVRENESTIKQVFVLTHNVYFHNEVTFISSRESNDEKSDTTFWILRKLKGDSYCTRYEENPIKSSYRLMWQNVKEAQIKNDITIQNTLRRILENYFKLLGGIDNEEILDKFTGEEKIICKSLISWINQGSHLIDDDQFVTRSIENQDKYLEIFKKIFYVTNHDKHYEMMMNNI